MKTPRLPAGAPLATPACTMEERLLRIEAISQRILGYVEFASLVGDLKGTSQEAKEKAIESFYEQMTVMEGTLRRTLEELQLG